MTLQLSKDLKTHIVLTFAGSKHLITSKQELMLRQMSDKDKVYTDTGMVRVSTIKEILPLEEYYKTNPDERPQCINYTFKNDISGQRGLTKEKRIKALNAVRNGFLKYSQNKEMDNVAKNILARINLRLKQNGN